MPVQQPIMETTNPNDNMAHLQSSMQQVLGLMQSMHAAVTPSMSPIGTRSNIALTPIASIQKTLSPSSHAASTPDDLR